MQSIRKLHLETTELCQAMCPMCDRVTLEGNVNPEVINASLSLDDIKIMFSIDFIKQLDEMYMCGNLGDPMLAPDCLEIFKYFREHSDLCLAGEDKNFINKFMTKTGQSIFNPAKASEIFSKDDF